MGNLLDYYRAPNRQTAVTEPSYPRVSEKPFPNSPEFDSVDAKWIDPNLILGQLIALIGDVSFSLDLVRTTPIYPPPDDAPKTEEEWAELPEDSPYFEGPGIEELSRDVRDTLADVPDARLTELAEQWAQIEEFNGPPDHEYLSTLVRELRDLARRARKEDQMISCWMSI
jgi:hypothetical protein